MSKQFFILSVVAYMYTHDEIVFLQM